MFFFTKSGITQTVHTVFIFLCCYLLAVYDIVAEDFFQLCIFLCMFADAFTLVSLVDLFRVWSGRQK